MNLKRNKKKIKINKNNYAQRIKERMGKYFEENPFKIHAKKNEKLLR